MNKIGVRGHDFGRMTVEKLPEYIKSLGFDAMQFAPNRAILGVENFGDITDALLERSRLSFEQNNLEISVYGCYMDIGLLDKEKRLEQVEFFKKGISQCKLVGGKIIGTETSNFPFNGSNREEAYQGLKDSVLRMVEEAEKQDVIIGIEPVSFHTLNSPELTKRLIDEVNSDKLRIILDIVNLFTVDNVDKQREIMKSAIECFGDKIEAMHLKDMSLLDDNNNGEVQLVNDMFKYEFIGEGIVDYKYLFEFINNKNISLLREEASLESYKTDIASMKSFLL